MRGASITNRLIPGARNSACWILNMCAGLSLQSIVRNAETSGCDMHHWRERAGSQVAVNATLLRDRWARHIPLHSWSALKRVSQALDGAHVLGALEGSWIGATEL